MREIKFRAWDTIENCWKIFDIQSMFEAKKVFNYKYRNFSNWQQFTGLKDKNGKEIYEGDIVNGNICDSFIEFDNFIVENLTGTKFEVWNGINTAFDLHDVYECEVIGNIFENPELINQP